MFSNPEHEGFRLNLKNRGTRVNSCLPPAPVIVWLQLKREHILTPVPTIQPQLFIKAIDIIHAEVKRLSEDDSSSLADKERHFSANIKTLLDKEIPDLDMQDYTTLMRRVDMTMNLVRDADQHPILNESGLLSETGGKQKKMSLFFMMACATVDMSAEMHEGQHDFRVSLKNLVAIAQAEKNMASMYSGVPLRN